MKTPKYISICDDLQYKIISSQLDNNTQLPTENELMDKYNASRTTIRKALQLLKERNMIVSIQGIGSFISYTPILHPVITSKYGLTIKSFSELATDNNIESGIQYISTEIISEFTENHTLLECNSYEKLIVTKRIRLLNGSPVSIEENIFPFSNFYFLVEEDLSQPLFSILKKHQIVPVSAEWVQLEAITPTPQIANLLNVNVYKAILFQTSLVNTNVQKTSYLSRQYFIGDRYKFFIKE